MPRTPLPTLSSSRTVSSRIQEEATRTTVSRCSYVRSKTAQFYEVVPEVVMDAWLPRATQICMIDLVGTVIALGTFRHDLKARSVLVFVDAEAVEGALVTGYSARCNVCVLVGHL